jgi:hypothetical protein
VSFRPSSSSFRTCGLLAGVALSFGLVHPACAQSDDDRELAAIKAQMRHLEAEVQAIERRHVQRGSPQGHGAGQTAAAVPAVAGARRSAVVAATAQPPDVLDVQQGLAGRTPPAGWAPTRTPIPTGPLQFASSVPHIAASSMDLTSSSPLAITQTAVDQLPPIFSIGNVSVRLGGFIDFSNIWRSSNMTSGPATAWNNFPYANSPNHGLDEERMSAQLSRFSVLLESNPTRAVRLQAYVETDFGGSAGTTNSVQISGYTPRLRQGYFTFTNKDWGVHLLMGQAWSLATNYAKGIVPRQEQLPPVTDNNQIPGITFTRVPQIRLGKDWGEKYWLGLSIEDPQATVAFSSALSSGGTLPAAYGQSAGTRVYYENAGGVLLNPSSEYTYNPAPDVILKGAVDTSFGHYEVFGMGRWFRSLAMLPGATTTRKSTTFGGGVGGGMTLPITSKVQLTGNVLAGQGIGRYGPSLLPDTTFRSNGSLTPVPEIMGSLGVIGHPAKSVLVYSYGGVESAARRTYTGANGAQYGYGVEDQDLGGCDVEFGTCNAQTRTLAAFTTGGWWHFLDGHYGSLMGGLQYTYIRKFAFRGNDGEGNSVYPQTSGNTVYVTFRYFPFQQ